MPLVAKLGPKLGYFLLICHLMSLWKPRGEMLIIDVGNGFFVAKFNLVEDRESILSNGPWIFFITT